jgi:phosphoserine phosphatase
MQRTLFILASVALLSCNAVTSVFAAEPLASWNDGETKSAIVHFVEEVTKKGGPHFVPEAERIATFDNDGTLWVEQPMYAQLLFAFDRVKQLAPLHPEWKDTEPFKSVLDGDLKSVFGGDAKSHAELLSATHAGMPTEQFDQIAKQWLATNEDARFKCLHTNLVYEPMLELLTYLRDKGFKTYIVSGGGIDFVRAFSEKVYGIPPEQVIGSYAKTKYEYNDGKPVIMRLAALEFVDDKDGKPIAIERTIGRRPVVAFGNSDGDLQMLQWTAAGSGPHLCAFVHHTDAAREYAYDRESKIGKLDAGLDAATKNTWTLVDMKNDWKTIFPKR